MVNLPPSVSRYKFRIKVENAYGISDASEESDAFDVGGVQIQDTRWDLGVSYITLYSRCTVHLLLSVSEC